MHICQRQLHLDRLIQRAIMASHGRNIILGDQFGHQAFLIKGLQLHFVTTHKCYDVLNIHWRSSLRSGHSNYGN